MMEQKKGGGGMEMEMSDETCVGIENVGKFREPELLDNVYPQPWNLMW